MQFFRQHPGHRSVVAALLVAAALGGCSQKNYLNPDDDLRRENLELRQSVEQLKKKDELRAAQVHTLEEQVHATTQPGMTGAEVPRAVALRFERYSGTVYEKGVATVRLYVSTLDQQGRFLPVAGKAAVQVVAIEAGHKPIQLAEKNYAPQEWDAAYRTGLTGTHYTVELPLPPSLPKGLGEITVKVTFKDAATGAVLTESRSFQVGRKE